MSHNSIRKDKTCLNCRHVVENRFCPNCGQENSDTRKTFHHLFIHFFEDLTHYENAFWRTIKNLLFKPSALTKEYLSGKRLSYLAPVRLYIFISFLTFFLLSVLPGENIQEIIKKEQIENKKNQTKKKTKLIGGDGFSISYSTPDAKKNQEIESTTFSNEDQKYYQKDTTTTKEDLELKKILSSKELSDSTKIKLKEVLEIAKKSKKKDKADFNFGYATIQALDSAKAKGKVNATTYWFIKKSIEVKENNTEDEIIEKGIDSAKHNFPKVLLIYMPLFAFFLWLFHGKKRWYYFDHGIFTLHYFSFLLLIFSLISTLTSFIELLQDNSIIKFLVYTIDISGYIWMFYYFFPAHHRFYGETRWISFIKSMVLFYINMFLIIIILVCFFLYTLINIH